MRGRPARRAGDPRRRRRAPRHCPLLRRRDVDGRLFWIGSLAVIAVGRLLGPAPVPVPGPTGAAALALLAALAALGRPVDVVVDRARPLLGGVRPPARLLRVRAPRPARLPRAAPGAAPSPRGLAVLLGLVLAWALLGKVIPSLFPDGARVARLRNPVGYWNSLALVAATAVPLGLWAARRAGTARRRASAGAVLVYLAELVVVLTYSRAGIAVAALAALAWVAVDARPARGARHARPRHAGRGARRAVGLLAARAHRRPPAVRGPGERRRLVRCPRWSPGSLLVAIGALARRRGRARRRGPPASRRGVSGAIVAVGAVAAVVDRPRRSRAARSSTSSAVLGRPRSRSRPNRLARPQLEQPLDVVEGVVAALAGRAGRRQGRRDVRDRAAARSASARSSPPSRTTCRSSSSPRPGSSASCSSSA